MNYIKSERQAYPPESVYNLVLDQGTPRLNYALQPDVQWNGWSPAWWWTNHRPDVFLERLPLYNFYSLARYYELTEEELPAGLMQQATAALNQELQEQDWASFYWFKGFAERRIAVTNANRSFAGLVGYVKLARLANDQSAENLGMALLSRAAALRMGMTLYPRYLDSAGLVELPSDPEWQTRGDYYGFFNLHWANAYDDARQVATLDQFETLLQHTSGFGGIDGAYNRQQASPELIAFRDMTPELGRLLGERAEQDANVYATKVKQTLSTLVCRFCRRDFGQ